MVQPAHAAVPLPARRALHIAHAQPRSHVASTPRATHRHPGALELREELPLVSELLLQPPELVLHIAMPLLLPLRHPLHLGGIEGGTAPAAEVRIGVLGVQLRAAAVAEVRAALRARHVVAPEAALHAHVAGRAALRLLRNLPQRPERETMAQKGPKPRKSNEN